MRGNPEIQDQERGGMDARGNLKHRRWHSLWTEGTGQLESSSPARRNVAGTGQPGRRRMNPSWNKQDMGRPSDCEKAEGSMYVSMSYKAQVNAETFQATASVAAAAQFFQIRLSE